MKMTYENYFKTWFETYKESGLRDVTIQKYLNVLDLLNKNKLGQIELKKVQRKDVQVFFNEYGKSRRKQTVLDTKTLINACFADAVHDGFIRLNPCARVEVNSVEDNWTIQQLKQVRDEKKWLELDEYKSLRMYLIGLLHVGLNQSDKDPMVIKNRSQQEIRKFNSRGYPPQMILMVIYIAMKTGARFSEIIGITENDVDFAGGLLNIEKTWDYKFGKKFAPTKNVSSIRKISVDQEFLLIMRRYLDWIKEYGIDLDSSAILVKSKVRIFNSTINSVLKDVFRAIDVEPITLHKLRHTQASMLIAQKISLQVIAKRLGHNDTTMIQKTYGHLLESVEEEENRKILELI